MKLSKYLIKPIGLSVLFYSSWISAQVSDVAVELQAKLSNLKTYQANFSQQVVDAQGEVLQNAQGQLTLMQPNKLHWQVAEPNENILIADGTTLWHVDPFVEQVVAIDQNQAIENNPMILLTNPQSDAWQDFLVSRQDNDFVIEAKAADAQIAKLTVSFEGDTLASLKIADHQQQTSHLQFTDIEQNQPIDEKLFIFSLPDGYELDDQRNQ